MKRRLLIFLLVIVLPLPLAADEGMWLPMLLKKYNISDMQKKGFRLTADDLYSVNRASLKDAVVQFGRGCTGEVVSAEGLVLTNHHCGYGQVQSHSSLEHNYLEHGFWAMSRDEELPNPGLTVKFLLYMEDVSHKVLDSITSQTPEEDRIRIVKERSIQIAKEAETGKGYKAEVKPVFYGNQYILYVYEEFSDVRLVGTPPDAIGKFGGDSDNWMWPRHTGDFAVFRIYAGRDNKPADYSPDNVPYKPKQYFKVSLRGIEENDFTFIYGYPGSTQQYIPSYAVEMLIEHNPHKIALRDKRLEIVNAARSENPEVYIQYASKQAGIANAWKKWQGELIGLNRLNAVEVKQQYEDRFRVWAVSDTRRKTEYGNVLDQLREVYQELSEYSYVNDYYREAVMGIELLSYCSRLSSVVEGDKLKRDVVQLANRFAKTIASDFYKDYSEATDRKLFVAMLESYHSNVPKPFHPEFYTKLYVDCGKSFERMAQKIYSETQLLDEVSVSDLLNGNDSAVIENTVKTDIAYQLFCAFKVMLDKKVSNNLNIYQDKANLLLRTYMRGMMEMEPNRKFYPDANLTLRVAYGDVDGFIPSDGERYKYYTTLGGVIEKSLLPADDYKAPERLKELYDNSDYGRYADRRGQQPVAFLATNHTTGGNSGSPVLNGRGELVGINFDRCWESTMSDIMYDPDFCRNISVDIRYVLFIIDKYAGAGHLINEMSVIQ